MLVSFIGLLCNPLFLLDKCKSANHINGLLNPNRTHIINCQTMSTRHKIDKRIDLYSLQFIVLQT